MHIHIHNEPGGIDEPITEAIWRRANIPGDCSIGSSVAEFDAVADRVELLIAPPWEIARLNLYSAPKHKLVQSTSAGVDSLRPFTMVPPNVLLMNNRGTHSEKAGEYGVMAILMLVNFMPMFVTNQRHKLWHRRTCALARTQRLTIIGLGSLGGAVARQAKNLGLTVTGIRYGAAPHVHCDRVLTLAALDQVLPETDILFLACPLTDATENLLSAARIALLPVGAGVINIGRGRLLDQDALCDALDQDRLAGAILDVFHTEPLPQDDRVWTTKNLIVTPHMSSDDPTTYNAITLAILSENLRAFEAGMVPPTAIDRAKGY
jgi:glyoxylate/hydroxypyruvate reductase A